MKATKAFFPFCFLLSAALLILQSSVTGQAQDQVTKDPQALAILSTLAKVNSWVCDSSREIVGTGTVIHYLDTGQDTIPVTVRMSGRSLLRVDSVINGSTKTTVVNGIQAVSIVDGTTTSLAAHSAISMTSMVLPFCSTLADFSLGTISIKYDGMESVNSMNSYKVEIGDFSTPDEEKRVMDSVQKRTARLTLWVSADTLLPIVISHDLVAEDNLSAFVTVKQEFSDYRNVHGMLIPFRQDNSIGNKKIMSMQFTTVQIIAQSASDFAIPTTSNEGR